MNRRVHSVWTVFASAMIALAGCRPQQPLYFHENSDLSHYLNVATDLEYPDVKTTTLAEVEEAPPPLTLTNTGVDGNWDLSLEEAVKTALSNTKVMRSLGGRYVSSAFNNRAQTGEAPDAITNNPDFARTIYDPAITETTPFNGVEYALSAFDAQWTTNVFYQKNDHQQNVQPQFPITQFFRQVFEQDTSTFNTQLQKVTATGGQLTVSNNVIYDLNNNPTRQIPKDWNANYQVQFNQPLLAGAGVQYNRIAGPYNPVNFNPIPGGAQQTPTFDGVVLARIAVDISLADFEGSVRDLVSDVENAYWELSFAWRNLDTASTALKSAQQTWYKIYALFTVGAKGGEAKEEAQSREQYFQFKANAQTLLNELYRAENRLRWAMGLAQGDKRLIRPTDTPTVARVQFDWREITQEALARNLSLRRQKWRIKQRELELIAAKNLLLPRLDLNGTYRWMGLGDTLLGTRPDVFSPQNPLGLTGSSALQTLASGQFQEWQLGAQMTMTLGFRREFTQVRHYQLQLAKERAKLQDLELEISHQLADAVRQLEYNYILTQTNFNRTLAADTQVDAVQAAFDAETVTLDLLLEAQRRRAESQATFFRTLLDYQRAIIGVHFRKGSLLEYNNVYLQEGPWPAKAKFDAHRLARQRGAGHYINYGFTRPSVVSQGAIRQIGTLENDAAGGTDGRTEGTQSQAAPQAEQAPEYQSVPQSEEVVPDTSPEGLPDPFAVKGRGRVLTSRDRNFQWGALGLAGSEAESDNDTTAEAAGEMSARQTGGDVDATLSIAERRSTLRSGATSRSKPNPRDGSVQSANHTQWKPAPKDE